MELPRIIGLNGKKGSGKDTAGAYLATAYGYTRLSFAEPLKRSAAAVLDIDPERFETAKNDPTAYVEYFDGAHVRITVREYLQRYGTEAHRDVFGPSFWTDMLLARVAADPEPNFVVTDARFENECRALRGIGGVIVEIVREGMDYADAHASEAELPRDLVDYRMYNSGTIPELYAKLDHYLI